MSEFYALCTSCLDENAEKLTAAAEIERLEAENFKLHERVCNAENELSDKNKRNKALRKVIASHKDRLTVASLDLEDDLIAANLGWKD